MKTLFRKIPKIYINQGGPFYPPSKFLFFCWHPLYWKDKFGTPRIEECPYIGIMINGIFYGIRFGSDGWWEQRIWWKYYCNNNYNKAKDLWPWVNVETNKSSWRI